jgi:beta-phosphoglucomutase-like phosphatase (HAD superfamily)
MNNHYGVIWDLDGVLVDTGEFHFQSWLKTLAQYQIPFDHDFFRKTFGMNNTGVLTTLLGHSHDPQLLSAISDEKEQLFRELIQGRVQPMSGVRIWLDRFAGESFLQAIGSSAPQANIDALVDEMGIRNYFKAIVSGANMPGKPDPAVFLEAACLMGIPAEKNLVIEDSVAGVAAARRAGMKCLAVLTSHSREALNNAHLVVEGLDQLLPDDLRKLIAIRD